jgi:hypothetical protein
MKNILEKIQQPKVLIPIMIVLLVGVVYVIKHIDSLNAHSHGDGESHSHP